MYKTGITGTIASGKTSVSILLKKRGFPVFNSDQYSRMITHQGNVCYKPLIQVLGEQVISDNGDIDRRKMADIIFHDEEKRKAVNAIAHPFVKEGLLTFFSHQTSPLVFAEVPLLFEAGWQDLFDEICVVTCTKETAVRRMKEYRQYSEEQAESRYDSQMDMDAQIQMADTVIHNDGSLKELDSEINKWVASLRRKSRNGQKAA